MRQVLIINASGYGREVYWMVRGSPQYGKDFVIKGFLDDRPNILEPYPYEHRIISSVQDYSIQPEDIFICAISLPEDKKKYATLIKNKGGVFMNLSHYTALLSANISFGEGVIIGSSTGISCDCKIGNFVTINSFVGIGHDAQIDDYVHVNSYAAINGSTKIGPLSVIHSHAVILPKLTIGSSCVIGAGSVAIKNVPDKTTVFGVPALPVVM